MFGFLNINKSAGMTSHDVVSRARRLLRVKQIGHAGTLDPAATGVLPLAVGSACRLIRFLPHDKTYLAEILLGRTTSTDDTQGETLSESRVAATEAQVGALLNEFSGEIDQIPPMVSAIHVDGERLYKLVREGRAPSEIPSRKVTVHSIELLDFASPMVKVRIHCSGGTYIRSIARDLGARLGCGGCLSSLVREQAGFFRLSDAYPIDTLADQEVTPLVRPEDALSLPHLALDQTQAERIGRGQRIEAAEISQSESSQSADYVMVLLNGDLLAVCKRDAQMLQPEVVIKR